MANQDGGRVLSSTKLVLIKRIPEFQEVEIVWQRFQSQILGEPLTKLAHVCNIVKAFPKTFNARDLRIQAPPELDTDAFHQRFS